MRSHSRSLLAVLAAVAVSVATGCHVDHSSSTAPTMDLSHAPDAPAPRGFLLDEQPADGRPLLYATYVPRSYDPAKPWPCILFMHGSGESGTDGLKQVIQGLGSAIQWNEKEWPFIVLFPQKPTSAKQWEEFDAPVMAMLAKAQTEYNIDPDRIYLTGLSQGGHGTWAFAAKHPGTFAAIAPICGYVAPLSQNDVVRDIGNVPIWAFHGLADDVVKPEATTKIIDAIRADRQGKPHAAEVKTSLYEGVNHGSWDRAYRTEQLAAWFLTHSRKPK